MHLRVCVTLFYRKPLLIHAAAWIPEHVSFSIWHGVRVLVRGGECRINTLTHAYWRYLAGPFYAFTSAPYSSSPPPGEHRVGGLQGSYLRSSFFPSSSNFCCPVLWNLGLTQDQRMVIHVQQVPVPWKPPFSPKNIPFYPFWRPVTGQSRHHTTPGQAMTKPIFCLLLDWLKKTF